MALFELVSRVFDSSSREFHGRSSAYVVFVVPTLALRTSVLFRPSQPKTLGHAVYIMACPIHGTRRSVLAVSRFPKSASTYHTS